MAVFVSVVMMGTAVFVEKWTMPNQSWASPPGDTLDELLEIMNISQAELARQLGRPKKMIDEIIKGKIAITAETALQLEIWFPKISARFWMIREVDYRLALAKMENPTIFEDAVKRKKRLNEFMRKWNQQGGE